MKKMYAYGKQVWVAGVCLSLSACAGLPVLKGGEAEKQQSVPVKQEKKVVGLAEVQSAFVAGKVMDAYAKAMTVKPKNPEYAQVREFLKDTINPTRIRLLRHYKNIAKHAERAGLWGKALSNYKQAAEFSAKPEVFDSNIQSMQHRIQQHRLDVLLTQRRLEDHVCLQGVQAYQQSKDLEKHDAILSEFAAKHQRQMDRRIELAYKDAVDYFQKGKLIPAYVLAESHLRLMPDSARGEDLMQQIQKQWPKWLKTTTKKVSRKKVKKSKVVKKPVKKEVVPTEGDILALLKQKKWTEAQNAVYVYRRHQGESAEPFFQQVSAQLKNVAKQLFHEGSLAFRQEHIDRAVTLWTQAVELDDQNESYLDALSRAVVLQERLHLLRNQKK